MRIDDHITAVLTGDHAATHTSTITEFLMRAGLLDSTARLVLDSLRAVGRVKGATLGAYWVPENDPNPLPDVDWSRSTPEPEPLTSADILARAQALQEERAEQYDSPGGERSMGKTVAAFNIIAGRHLTESEGWLLLQILKDVRDRTTFKPHRESLEDCVSYAALKAEARVKEKS